jgi:hypothetical protein
MGQVDIAVDAYSEVECDLRSLVLDIGEEACFLVRAELIREGSCRYEM